MIIYRAFVFVAQMIFIFPISIVTYLGHRKHNYDSV